jgi:hypothetical protein
MTIVGRWLCLARLEDRGDDAPGRGVAVVNRLSPIHNLQHDGITSDFSCMLHAIYVVPCYWAIFNLPV